MTRYWKIMLVALLGAVIATACSGDGSSTSRRFLSIGTAPPGGAFFVVGGALGEVLTEFKGENGWDVTSEATKGTMENIRRLGTGELEDPSPLQAVAITAPRSEYGMNFMVGFLSDEIQMRIAVRAVGQ